MSFINILLSLGWLSNNLVLNMHLIFLVASFILFVKPNEAWEKKTTLPWRKTTLFKPKIDYSGMK